MTEIRKLKAASCTGPVMFLPPQNVFQNATVKREGLTERAAVRCKRRHVSNAPSRALNM